MAYLSNYSQGGFASASTLSGSIVCAIDDILLVWVVQDANTSITMNTSGWTQLGSQTNAGTGLTVAAWIKRATSTSEAYNLTMTDAYTYVVYVIRDVDTAFTLNTPSNYSITGNASASSQFSSLPVTTVDADCFILYLVGIDGIAVSAHSDPGVMHIHAFDNGGTTSTTAACSAAAWYQQRAVGATPAPTWTASASGAYALLTVALKNKNGGIIPAYIDDAVSPASLLVGGHHFSTLNGISFPASLSLANIGPAGSGKSTLYDAAAATADFGINPYSAALASTPAIQAASGVAGFQINFTAAKNLSSGFVLGSVMASSPKQANFDHGSVSEGGSYIAFADASNNYRSYQIVASDSTPNTEGRALFSVQPSQAVTAYGTNGSMNASAVDKILFLSNNPRAAITLYYAEIYKVNKIIIAGGVPASPVSTDGVASVGKSFRLPVIKKNSSASLLAYAPLQIGGGDAINFQVDAGALEFPRIYDTEKKEINYHATNNAIGISYAGKSGDVIKHTNSVVASPSPFYWSIDSSATSAATWDFTGLTVSGANVTLRNVMTFNGMTFSSCPTLDVIGCSLSNCTVNKVPTTNDTLSANATSSFNACKLDVSQVAAGNRWGSLVTPEIFSNCTFTGGGGHAIRITTPGVYSFVGNTFTGFGADGSTGAAIYNDSGGAVTLNISGGGSTPTVRNGAGASTTVNNTKTLTLTGLIAGSDIVILDAGTSTERANVDANAGASYAYSFSTGGNVDICIYKQGYRPYCIRSYTLPTVDGTLPMAQVADPNFNNP